MRLSGVIITAWLSLGQRHQADLTVTYRPFFDHVLLPHAALGGLLPIAQLLTPALRLLSAICETPSFERVVAGHPVTPSAADVMRRGIDRMSCQSAGCSFIMFLALSASTVQVTPCENIEYLVAALRRHMKHMPVALLAICSMVNLAQDETGATVLVEAARSSTYPARGLPPQVAPTTLWASSNDPERSLNMAAWCQLSLSSGLPRASSCAHWFNSTSFIVSFSSYSLFNPILLCEMISFIILDKLSKVFHMNSPFRCHPKPFTVIRKIYT